MIHLQENQIIFYQTFKDTPELKAGRYVFILDKHFDVDARTKLALAHEQGAVMIRDANHKEKEIWFILTSQYPNQQVVKLPEESEYDLTLMGLKKQFTYDR